MSRLGSGIGLAGVAVLTLAAPHSRSQPRPTQPPPRLVPVAETRLLMEGLTKPNFDGLARALQKEPADAETWAVVRGQSLLVAEAANLLLIRPPKTRDAQQVWVPRVLALREIGVKLAEAAAAKDHATAKAELTSLATACNRCHESFRVPVRIDPDKPN